FPQPAPVLHRIVQGPDREQIRMPTVVDVIVILVRTGYTAHDARVLVVRPVYTLRPEPRPRDQYLQSILAYICLVAGVAYVIVYHVGDGAIPVNLLKRDLPFVMALLTVHGHHGIQCSAVAESQLPRVLNRFLQMLIPVDEQVPGHTGRCRT